MPLCAQCGIDLNGTSQICNHHHDYYKDDWAKTNRIMCDFIHRKKIPRRLSKKERSDDIPGQYVYQNQNTAT